METTLQKMGTKNVFPLLVTMALPPMASMLIQSLYNIVDSMFVAQYSHDALTAVSLAFPIQTLIVSCSVGIGVGVNSYISRKLGEHDQLEANSAVMHGLLLAAGAYALFLLIACIGIRPFFSLFTKDVAIWQDACSYTFICVLFSFGCFFHICIEKVFQASGKMMFPTIIQAIGAIINIILDPLLIFGWSFIPAMGVKGAAIATIIGQIAAMSLSFYVLLTKPQDVKIDMHKFRFSGKTVQKILAVGIPNACMNALGSILVMGLNAILVTFSNAAVSVFGIYFKLQTFVFMPASGLTQGAMPIMGYNYGAKKYDRLMQTLRYSLFITAGIMVCGFLLFELFPNTLLALFDADEKMLTIGVEALRIIALSFLPAIFGFIFPTLFQAMGKGIPSLAIFLLRQCVITLPLSFVLSRWMGLDGIWYSFLVAESIAALVAFFLFLRIRRKELCVLDTHVSTT